MAISPKFDIFQRYHRGFLGKPIRAINPETDASKILKQLKNLQFSSNVFTVNDDGAILNEDVEVLYSQYTKRAARTGTFEFHESILRVALVAFGTNSFLEWLEVQKQSPVTSYTHSKFILDTLRFIQTGKREMILENWEPLLDSDALSSEWEDVIPKALEIDKFLKIGNLRDVLTIWCTRPNGIIDLLITMHILFGR